MARARHTFKPYNKIEGAETTPSGLMVMRERTVSVGEQERECALHEMIQEFVDRRCYNRKGDILLTHESRLEGYIRDYLNKYFEPKPEYR